MSYIPPFLRYCVRFYCACVDNDFVLALTTWLTGSNVFTQTTKWLKVKYEHHSRDFVWLERPGMFLLQSYFGPNFREGFSIGRILF